MGQALESSPSDAEWGLLGLSASLAVAILEGKAAHCGLAFCYYRRVTALPVYEYRCGGGHHYETTEGFHAPTEHGCPTCGKKSRRQLSLPAVIFKGSGFYSTDNRKGGGSRSTGVTAASDSDGSSNGGSHDGDNGHSPSSEPKVEAAAD